jgi:hypothetical protein
VPHDFSSARINLQEVSTRNRTARRIVAGFSSATPALSEFWQHIDTALADTPALSAEITRLNAEAAAIRRDRADLLAAAQATIGAHRDGEPEPLSYLCDELRARGQLAADSRGRT